MNRACCLALLLLISLTIKAQEKYSLYLDIGGASPYASVNLDKRFKSLSGAGLGYKMGFGFVLEDMIEPTRVTVKLKPSFPMGLNYVFGRDRNSSGLEVAVQCTYIPEMSIPEAWDPTGLYLEPVNDLFLPSLFIGYRFKPFKNKSIIRVGFSPFLLQGKWQNWFNLSMGWIARKKLRG
jgi:hypothetical protein